MVPGLRIHTTWATPVTQNCVFFPRGNSYIRHIYMVIRSFRIKYGWSFSGVSQVVTYGFLGQHPTPRPFHYVPAAPADAISREPAKAESCRARRRQTLWSGGFSAVRPPRRPHAMQSSSATAASVPPVPSWLRSCAGGRRLPDCSSAQHSKRGSRQ